MTPSALTPAARGSRKKPRSDAPSRPSAARGSGHRANVRRSVAPTGARRVSGPTGGAAAAAAAAAAVGGVIAVPAPGRTRSPERSETARSADRPPASTST